jgi:secreted PhoX family phosphatase
MNHEYADDALLHPGGMAGLERRKVRKSQAAHASSVTEIAWQGRPLAAGAAFAYARRFTANTPIGVGGPAAGHALMKTAADPRPARPRHVQQLRQQPDAPWGTYLSGEENFAYYFNAAEQADAHERRWGLRKARRRLPLARARPALR